MSEYEELLQAAEILKAKGNDAAAAAALKRAEKVKPKSFGTQAKEFLLGDDDPDTMNAGEKIGQFINDMGETMTGGLIGDEASAFVGSKLNPKGGSYDERLARNRKNEEMFAESNPVASVAADVLGGVGGALIPGGAAMKALGLGAKGATWASNAARNTLAGAGFGGVNAFAEGEGGVDNRLKEGVKGAGVGAAAGFAAPEALRALGAVARKAGITKSTPVKEISRALGVNDEIAEMIALNLDDDAIDEGLKRADTLGDDFMLADTPALMPALDAAANASPQAGRIASKAITGRVRQAGDEATAEMDRALGTPVGVAERTTGIRQNSLGTRGQEYDKAYSQRLDYNSPSGEALTDALKRVPQDVRSSARRLMDIEGVTSKGRKVAIEPDGTLSVKKVPDTREIDYMTRSMGDAAEATRGQGSLRGLNSEGRAISSLQREIRTLLKRLNPEYKKAVGTAKRDIRDIAALEAGEKALTANVTRSEFGQLVQGMSASERRMLKAGVRDFIDDKLARIKPTMLSGGDTEVREAQEIVKLLGSKDVKDKLRMMLPAEDSKKLVDVTQKAALMTQLMAETAANSKTAMRTALRQAMRDTMEPGAGTKLLQGRPAAAAQDLMQDATGTDINTINRDVMRGFAALARKLTETKGADARKALELIQRGMKGEKLSEAQTSLLIRSLNGAFVGGAYSERDAITDAGMSIVR